MTDDNKRKHEAAALALAINIAVEEYSKTRRLDVGILGLALKWVFEDYLQQLPSKLRREALRQWSEMVAQDGRKGAP